VNMAVDILILLLPIPQVSQPQQLVASLVDGC
jgi:hypothetical protein